ncbi:hypothetical protein QPX96_05645 [Limosilactobacillus fermentum]|nr:hypothetical protein [Limosilactobacillus fermentum]
MDKNLYRGHRLDCGGDGLQAGERNGHAVRVTKERTKRVKEERKILELKVELERLKHQPPVDEPAAPLQEVEVSRKRPAGW